MSRAAGLLLAGQWDWSRPAQARLAQRSTLTSRSPAAAGDQSLPALLSITVLVLARRLHQEPADAARAVAAGGDLLAVGVPEPHARIDAFAGARRLQHDQLVEADAMLGAVGDARAPDRPLGSNWRAAGLDHDEVVAKPVHLQGTDGSWRRTYRRRAAQPCTRGRFSSRNHLLGEIGPLQAPLEMRVHESSAARPSPFRFGRCILSGLSTPLDSTRQGPIAATANPGRSLHLAGGHRRAALEGLGRGPERHHPQAARGRPPLRDLSHSEALTIFTAQDRIAPAALPRRRGR